MQQDVIKICVQKVTSLSKLYWNSDLRRNERKLVYRKQYFAKE
jgi:hypothetical protein